MTLCAHHRQVHAGLRAALGRRHHGHRVARQTLEQIARSCPECIAVSRGGVVEPRTGREATRSRPDAHSPAEARFGEAAA